MDFRVPSALGLIFILSRRRCSQPHQVFELTVNSEFFKYEKYEEHGLDEAAGHLWQMLCFTGEGFEPEQLQASELAGKYFDSTCALSRCIQRTLGAHPCVFVARSAQIASAAIQEPF
jgi:hypothetical protein